MKYHKNLHVPWHTHLYRAGLAIFSKDTKPWHTHVYRALHSALGNKRYAVDKLSKNSATKTSFTQAVTLTEGRVFTENKFVSKKVVSNFSRLEKKIYNEFKLIELMKKK